MRRLLVFCAVAVAVLAAYAVAQNSSAGAQSSTGLPPNARVVATDVAARALALDSLVPDFGGHLYFTYATSPDMVVALRTDGMQSVSSALSGAPTDAFAPTKKLLLLVTPVAGTGRAGSLGDGGAATSAQLDLAADSFVERSGIAVAADGTIFIADTQNSTIRSVGAAASSEPGVIRSVAGRWAGRQNIALGQPMGIAVDRAGNLYIADYSAGAVDVLSAATGQLSTLAQVISPASIAVTPDGSEVFVASPATGAVFAITTSSGSIAAVSGFAPAATANSSAPGPCANVGSTAQAAAAGSQQVCPAGLAADARGDLFVADASGGKIIRVDAKTGKSSSVASGLSVPGAIALDAKGNLFVAEQGASRVIVLPDVTANSGNITLTAPAAFAAPCPQTTDPFTYCNMPTGGTSPTAAFTLTNTSSTTAAMTVAISVTSADFTVENKNCTVNLPASGTCLINVAFTPQGSGARTGTLTVTDSDSGDSATYDLAGTGDNYSLQLASGQAEEVNVVVGGTATFKAEVVPDSVFGQNGEMVKFQCPSNLPLFATCSFSPCPVAITPGAAVAFSVTFVTSSSVVAAPGATPCGGSSGVGPGVTRNPTMILRAAPERWALPDGRQFPSLWWLALAAIALAIFAGGTLIGGRTAIEERSFDCVPRRAQTARRKKARDSAQDDGTPLRAGRMGRITPSMFAGHSMLCPYEETAGSRKRKAMRVRYIFALAGFAMALMIGCHGNKTKAPPTTPVTPTGVTSMTILGNATDASGNPLGTSRSLQVTLDVVTQ